MNRLLENKGRGFYLSMIAALLTLVAVIAYCIDAASYADTLALIVVSSVVSIASAVVVILAAPAAGGKEWLNGLVIAQSVSVTAAVMAFIYMRVNHIGWAVVGYEPWGTAFLIASVCYIVALIMVLVAGFYTQTRE